MLQDQWTPLVSSFADDQDIAELIDVYVAELPDRLQAIQGAQQRDDLVELALHAHRLKGSGGSHGFDLLTEVAAEVEHAARDRARPRLDQALLRLHQVIARIRKAHPQVGN